MTRSHDSVEMKIPAKPEYVGVVRLTGSGVANRIGFNYEDIEDIKVALSEACTNAVHHAYESEENGEISVTFNVYSDRLEMMVADAGRHFDLEQIQKRLGPLDIDQQNIDNMNEGGLGLFLIDTLMDTVEVISDSGVVVQMTKYLKRDEVEERVDPISAPQSK
ncbi:anti-sigma B factor RsbW [Bacillaceae bacterium SIJ1]|uniref:anti-sigma B factor RsbW n=1 Tax=Litoribacterium kuwaitense TaxID=1398745 RepID=UPI0013EE2E97|nr:anti-sigma B factor RsbW [Litoribacterium kuwaitense]NGP46244.1 anti-sigma B factor RsbW [Litoribacterium kuwaitense]